MIPEYFILYNLASVGKNVNKQLACVSFKLPDVYIETFSFEVHDSDWLRFI